MLQHHTSSRSFAGGRTEMHSIALSPRAAQIIYIIAMSLVQTAFERRAQ